MNAKKLEELMCFSPGELEATAKAYEEDEWPAGRTIRMDPSSLTTPAAMARSAVVRSAGSDEERKHDRDAELSSGRLEA